MKRLHVNSLMLLARPRLISIVALTLFGIVGHVHGQWTTTGNDISNSNTGNVGVGTTTPLFKFHVRRDWDAGSSTNILAAFNSYDDQSRLVLRRANGNVGSETQVLSGQNIGGLQFRGWTSGGSFTASSSASITALAAENFTSSGAGATLQFTTTGIGSTTPSVRMTIDAAGNVGIGSTTPTYRFDVQGGFINTSSGLCINSDCKSAWAQVASQWTTNGTTINYGAGNVGIGISAPTTKLDVNGTVNATGLTVSGAPVVSSQWTSSGTTINYANGNVGVATAVPTEKLHVTGNIRVTGNIDVGGNINAKYQDVAEWVESSQELASGTVVVLDPTKSNKVIASTQSYDSRVAGVISAQPGIALGEQREGRVLVATTGRVTVKVDAMNGPIQIGDLLVTSDKEGVAMKSVPVEIGTVRIHRPGTLIGKALEPLAQGMGEILVLLSLQ